MSRRRSPVFALAALILAAASPAAADGTVDKAYDNSGNVYNDLPPPPVKPKVQPGPPEGRVGLRNKALGGPDTRPSADGTRWDFTKNSNFRLPDGTKAPKGPALKAR